MTTMSGLGVGSLDVEFDKSFGRYAEVDSRGMMQMSRGGGDEDEDDEDEVPKVPESVGPRAAGGYGIEIGSMRGLSGFGIEDFLKDSGMGRGEEVLDEEGEGGGEGDEDVGLSPITEGTGVDDSGTGGSADVGFDVVMGYNDAESGGGEGEEEDMMDTLHELESMYGSTRDDGKSGWAYRS